MVFNIYDAQDGCTPYGSLESTERAYGFYQGIEYALMHPLRLAREH